MSYVSLSELGNNNSSNNNPLSYCMSDGIDTSFKHGTLFGPKSKQCQLFMSQRCSQVWDGACELASNNTSKTANLHCSGDSSGNGCRLELNNGDLLIRNTAIKKYRTAMYNCQVHEEQFDPNVPNSPMITYITDSPGNCGPCMSLYEVDPKNIEKDPVMNKLLNNPRIALDILKNIYNTMKNKDTLKDLEGTRLYKFFTDNSVYFNTK